MIYIKFRHPDDVYAINPSYDLSFSGEDPLPKFCPRCGKSLYIPVELPEESSITQAMGNIFRPFPREKPGLIICDDPEPIYLGINRQLSFLEQERLKHFPSIAYVDDNHFDLMIDNYSTEPVKHKCIA